MRTLRSHRSPIAFVLLSLYLPACTSSHVVAVPPPAQLVETARPPSIRLTLTDRSALTLGSPMVRGDSLLGFGSRDVARTRGVALSEIASASVDKPTAISWNQGTPTPAQYVEGMRPASIRVMRPDGSTITLESPVVLGDSLAGRHSESQDSARAVSLALSDISRVSIRKPDTGKTVLLVIGSIALGIGIIFGALVLAYAASYD